MKGVLSVFGKRSGFRVDAGGIENVIWLCDEIDDKRHPGQWADETFYTLWLKGMEWAFNLLGMQDRYIGFKEETSRARTGMEPRFGLVPVVGWQNRQALRKAAENIERAFSVFQLVSLQGGKALRYTDRRETALEQWEAVIDLLAKTMVVTLATQALEYYVQGSQVGYTPGTRHLFKRGNTAKRIGAPSNPAWELNVSGFRVLIAGKWDDIQKTHQDTGYNILQMLQIRLNEELEEALKREG